MFKGTYDAINTKWKSSMVLPRCLNEVLFVPKPHDKSEQNLRDCARD